MIDIAAILRIADSFEHECAQRVVSSNIGKRLVGLANELRKAVAQPTTDETALAAALADREHWYLLALERAQRIDELEHTDREVLCAQAVEFAQYVVEAAKGKMVERAEHFLSAPYAQALAKRITKETTLVGTQTVSVVDT